MRPAPCLCDGRRDMQRRLGDAGDLAGADAGHPGHPCKVEARNRGSATLLDRKADVVGHRGLYDAVIARVAGGDHHIPRAVLLAACDHIEAVTVQRRHRLDPRVELDWKAVLRGIPVEVVDDAGERGEAVRVGSVVFRAWKTQGPVRGDKCEGVPPLVAPDGSGGAPLLEDEMVAAGFRQAVTGREPCLSTADDERVDPFHEATSRTCWLRTPKETAKAASAPRGAAGNRPGHGIVSRTQPIVGRCRGQPSASQMIDRSVMVPQAGRFMSSRQNRQLEPEGQAVSRPS
jgi:hypothetical protein